jgi:hypothetical protein
MIASGDGSRGGKGGGEESAAASRLDRAHERILGLLEDLAKVGPSGMQALLDEFATLLPAHFADEERDDGLFAELRSERPAVDARLKALVREHREILQALDALANANRELARQRGRLEEQKVAFLRRLRAHERAESRLVLDTYLIDEGGPG